MWKRLFKRHPVQTVMGHRIAEPRLTWMALGWALVYLGLPVLIVGTLTLKPNGLFGKQVVTRV